MEPQLFGEFQAKVTSLLVFNEVVGANGAAGFIESTVYVKLL